MSIICLATVFCLVVFFRDRQRVATQKPKKKSSRQIEIEEVSNTRTLFGLLTVYDACILGCMLLNVATKGSIASFETMGIAYAETHFNMQSQQAGSLVATCGSIGVFALLSMGTLETWFDDIGLICGGMVVMATGIMSLSGMREGVENPHWRYFLAMFFIYATGYPIGHTAVIGLFSKSKSERSEVGRVLFYRSLYVSSFFSCRKKAAGTPARMVCLGWFTGSNYFSYCVRVYC